MSEEHEWSHKRLNDIPIGTLVRFVHAAPRFKGEDPRDPGHGLLDQLAITTSIVEPDGHGWGGIIYLNAVRGDSFSHYGDFLETV